jgi:hypothetical protein
VADKEDEIQIRYSTMVNEHCLDNDNENAVESIQNKVSREWGTDDSVRIDAANKEACMPHKQVQFLQKAFPHLYPDAKGGDYKDFQTPMSLSEYLKHAVMFGDCRFIKDYRFVFTMINIKMRDQAYHSISPALNSGWKNNKEAIVNNDINKLCTPDEVRTSSNY